MVVVAAVACAAPAQAELAFFSNGRTLSIRSHRVEGDSLILSLRGGGEIVCDPLMIVRFTPDEVPYPEPEKAAASDSASGLSAETLLEPDPRYSAIIERVSAKNGVDAKLVQAMIQVESGYQERARSPKGAMGLMQLMPQTARQFRVTDPYDPQANIEGGTRYMRTLLDRFPLNLALAAYNAGEAQVVRFQGVPPYGETRNYVTRILQLLGR
jgi:soluble lytic murein transglycosylase-like protein